MKYVILLLLLPFIMTAQIDTSHIDSVPEIQIDREYGFEVIRNGNQYTVIDTFENDQGNYVIEVSNKLTKPELNAIIQKKRSEYLKRHTSSKQRYVRNAKAMIQDSIQKINAQHDKQYYLNKIRQINQANQQFGN